MRLPILLTFSRHLLRAVFVRRAPVIVLDVPLLFESKFSSICDLTVVVSVSESVQIQRLQTRDRTDRESALQRINAQMPLALKRKLADLVVDNDSTLENLIAQLEGLLHSNAHLNHYYGGSSQNTASSQLFVPTKLCIVLTALGALVLVTGRLFMRVVLRALLP